jgi:hypothetical protein
MERVRLLDEVPELELGKMCRSLARSQYSARASSVSGRSARASS